MAKSISKWANCALFLLLTAPYLPAQQSVLTQHYDNARTGQNINESILTPVNVNSSSFARLFKLPVQGYVYAQPLYVPNVAIPGQGTHNVLYVATEHDQLYAFDADTGTLLWQVNFLINGATTLTPADVGNTQDINPEIGITGTPVIDPAMTTLYVVVNTKENGVLIDRLHALDITTGAEKFGGPVQLAGSVPGTALDGDGTNVPFNVKWANQRPGLLWLNGFVFIGFSSHGDNGPWHGWVLGYNATSLQQTGIWCTSPNGKGNGIWASGSGLAADASGNAYVATGNGDDTVTTPAPPPSTTIDYGDSIVRISLNNGVPIPTDYFTPFNQDNLSTSDADLGSGGVLVLPDQSGPNPHILIQAGKQGRIYVINRDKMTSDGSHYCNGCTSDPEIVQTVNAIDGMWSMPAYWNGNVYFWATGDHLKQLSLTAGTLSVSPTSESSETSGFPGSTPVVSSNGTADGIVWAVESDFYSSNGPSILRAYDATRVSTLLYASNLTGGRDTLGAAVKFVVPVVTNGKVYVGTQNEVDVFGLTNSETPAAAPVFNPPGGSYTAVQVSMSSTTPNSSIFYTTDGSTPSTGSTLYTGPVNITFTTTVKAIAVANGFLQSTISTATYTIASQAAPPTFMPAPGTYVTAQSVSLTDDSPSPVIYYTTDGTNPTHNSTVFLNPITVSATTTIKAIASSPGLNDSAVVTGVFTINPNGTTSINFGMGFSNPGCMQFNGSTGLDDSRLQLTNGGTNEAGSAFCTTPVDIRGFSTDFTFQLSVPQADGITFTIQNSPAGPGALGPDGAGLGYGPDTPGKAPGIGNSVAVKYDLFSNAGEGPDSTGLYTDGASPTVPATDMTASGVDLHSGDTMSVHMTYDGVVLTMTITDTSANKSFTTSWPVNIPSLVGGNNAYVGFTGGTGGQTASQKIETWTFVSSPPISSPPSLTSLAPTSATLGGAAFTLTLTGTGFVAGATVNFGSNPAITPSSVTSTQIVATIPAADIATAGTVNVTVANPAGGGTSNAQTFTINNPAPTATSLSPTSATAGGAAFTLTVNGTGFVSTSVVKFNGAAKTTTFVSATQVTAAITAADITTAGTATVNVTNPAPGGGASGDLSFTTNPVSAPVLTSVVPAAAAVGGAAFTLNLTGTGFVAGATVSFGTNPAITPSSVTSAQIVATIPAADITTAGTVNVTVANPAGGGTSNAQTFTINNPAPTATSLSPTSATAGGAAFTLTVNGTGFVSTSVVKFNGAAKTTTLVSATQLTAAITTADIATAGTASVTVTNPAPGGGTSSNLSFTINSAAGPALTFLAPTSATLGGAAFTLTLTGTGFVAGATVNFGSNPAITPSSVTSTQIVATIPAADITTAGTVNVTVANPAGGGTSNAQTFTINNPAPTATSLSPTSATAGGAAFTLTVNGTGFVSTSVVKFNGAAKTTTLVSATQLTAAITAADIATAGTASVTVTNPAPGGTSNAVSFTINNAVPTISSLSPSSVVAGSAAFTLTVNGASFVTGATVNFNGVPRATTFVSTTQITAAILAADIASPGTANVTVINPAPTPGPSGSQIFTISSPNSPVPTISSLGPTHAPGGTAFTLTVNGTNFEAKSVINFKGKPETTTFVSVTTISAAIPASDVATAGNANVTVTNPPPGGGTSPASVFTVDGYSLGGPSGASLTFGQPAMIQITATPTTNGFTNPISFSVSGLPTGATASFNPTMLTLNGAAKPTMLTITNGTSTAARGSAGTDGSARLLQPLLVTWFVVIFGWFCLRFQVRAIPLMRRYARLALFALILLTGGVLGGCAMGVNSPSVNSSQLTVTATSGTFMQTVGITLQVTR